CARHEDIDYDYDWAYW
nr:immunoglobulin heavy chain junction region [Mus musculus]